MTIHTTKFMSVDVSQIQNGEVDLPNGWGEFEIDRVTWQVRGPAKLQVNEDQVCGPFTVEGKFEATPDIECLEKEAVNSFTYAAHEPDLVKTALCPVNPMCIIALGY